MDWYELASELEPHLRQGDLIYCSASASAALESLPKSPFHIAVELHFTNDPAVVARHFDKFLEREKSKFDVRAVYTETNGFDINPDRWYFDLFAYDDYGGLKDLDWLSDWRSGDFPSVTLTGMEQLQAVYASDSFNKPEYSAARDFASLLVVLRFQSLIGRSAPLMKLLNCPVLATSHDYDYIFEYPSAA